MPFTWSFRPSPDSAGHTTTLGWNAGGLRWRTRSSNRLGYERYGVHGNDSGATIPWSWPKLTATAQSPRT